MESVESEAPGSDSTKVCSVIIPCFDEALTIEAKLANCLELRAEGWDVEILVCDDWSSDRTFESAEAFAEQHPGRIRCLRNRGEKGKAHAINEALRVSRGEIWVMTDADVHVLTPELDRALRHFDDPQVGAVCARQIDTYAKRGAPQPLCFRTGYEVFRDALRAFESRHDSAVVPHGQFLMIRASCDVGPRPGVRCDDIDISLRLRESGSRVRFEPQLRYLEFRERDVGLRGEVFARRAEAAVEVFMLHFREFFLRPRHGLFGMLAFPVEWALYCLQPFVLLSLVIAGVSVACWSMGGAGCLIAVGAVLCFGFLFRNLLRMEWYLVRGLWRAIRIRRGSRTDRWPTTRERGSGSMDEDRPCE